MSDNEKRPSVTVEQLRNLLELAAFDNTPIIVTQETATGYSGFHILNANNNKHGQFCIVIAGGRERDALVNALKAQLDEAVGLLGECRYHLQGAVTGGYIELSEKVGVALDKHKGAK